VIEHARLAGDRVVIDWAERQLIFAQYFGSTPVEESLRWLDEHPDVDLYRGPLLAMLGRFADANRLLAQAGERITDLGAVREQVFHGLRRFEVARLEGDAPRTEAAAREACEAAEATAVLGNFMRLCCNLARALFGLGRDDEAEQWLERGRETAPSDEPLPQMLWRQVRGKVLARRGELQEGEQLVRSRRRTSETRSASSKGLRKINNPLR